jgi:hypothetical protein
MFCSPFTSLFLVAIVRLRGVKIKQKDGADARKKANLSNESPNRTEKRTKAAK